MIIDINKILTGKVVSVIATGNSLRGFDFAMIPGYRIAVNDAVKYITADMLVALDAKWWQKNKEASDNFKGIKISQNGTITKDVKIIQFEPYNNHDWYFQKANNTGYAALAIALHLGARKVYLFGFDGGWSKYKYFYSEGTLTHPGVYLSNMYFEYFRYRTVVNVNNKSHIDCFHKVNFNEFCSCHTNT